MVWMPICSDDIVRRARARDAQVTFGPGRDVRVTLGLGWTVGGRRVVVESVLVVKMLLIDSDWRDGLHHVALARGARQHARRSVQAVWEDGRGRRGRGRAGQAGPPRLLHGLSNQLGHNKI